jgi:hypothetical protein
MKSHVLFPLLLAAAGLTLLMLLFMSSAGQVAGLPAVTPTPAEAETFTEEAAGAAIVLTSTPGVSLPWQAVAPGIDYVELHLQNPDNNVYVARMHREALTVTLETSIASGYLYSGKESVSQMASRYDQAIGYWGQSPLTPTWGSRNDVIVAINGSYFDIPSGNPWSGMVQSGWYAKRFDDLGGSSGFAWKLDRSAFIGECVDHPGTNDTDTNWKQLITYTDGYSQTFQGINITRTNHTRVLFTPQYDTTTRTGNTNLGTEVVIQLSRPLLIIPKPRAVTGTITAIYTATGSTPIPFDSVVLSVGKAIDDPMWPHLQVGEVISISQEIRSWRFKCDQTMSLDWGKTYASLSGAFYFLRNSAIRHFPDDPGATERLPRTAIALNSDYIYFIVVDGRSWPSRGMSTDELAIFARDTLSATHGITQDGGGSSTMVINGEVQNSTLCNNAICDHFTFLPLLGRISETLTATQVTELLMPAPAIHSDEIDAATYERYVANGIMMVLVEPMQVSTAFTPTQPVATKVRIDLRLGPGSNYGAPWDIAKDTSGVIVDHPMNGVLAKGAYWWKVDFGDVQGWVRQGDIASPTDEWR